MMKPIEIQEIMMKSIVKLIDSITWYMKHKLFYWIPETARLPLLILGSTVLFFCFILLLRSPIEPNTLSEKTWIVSAQTVKYTPATVRILSYGKIIPARMIHLRSSVSGRVIETSKNLQEGAYLKKGDILLQIDPFEYENTRDEIQAKLFSHQALEHMAQQDLERAKTLFSKDTISQRHLDEKETDYALKKTNVEQLEISLRRADKNLQDTRLVMPFDAYINNINAQYGHIVNPNETIVTLHEAHAYKVQFNISDTEYGALLKSQTPIIGEAVKISWKIGEYTTELTAKITQIGANINKTTHGLDIFADILLDTTQTHMRGGAFVKVTMTGQHFESIIQIPHHALFENDTVYLISNNRLKALKVEKITQSQGYWFITGPAEGEQILLTKFPEVTSGIRVEVQ